MFKRNALDWLNEWKHKEGRKPLVIRGARQVGKTSLVKEFGKQFDAFVSFNLEVADDLALFQKEVPDPRNCYCNYSTWFQPSI